MATQKETKQWMLQAWEACWSPDLAGLSEFFNEDIESSAFTPPKQTTWKGLAEWKAHLKSIQPIISCKSFDIERIDIINNSDDFYAAWSGEFELKIPGQEGGMGGKGIIYCTREGGKAKIWTTYEDPTPFVRMAMQGQMPSE